MKLRLFLNSLFAFLLSVLRPHHYSGMCTQLLKGKKKSSHCLQARSSERGHDTATPQSQPGRDGAPPCAGSQDERGAVSAAPGQAPVLSATCREDAESGRALTDVA